MARRARGSPRPQVPPGAGLRLHPGAGHAAPGRRAAETAGDHPPVARGRIEEGVVKYQATFHYTILYSGVKSLRIDVPAEVAATLRNTTPGIRDKTIDPPPADVAKGMVAWSFSGEAELIGKGKIELVWEKKIDKLDLGKSVDSTCRGWCPATCDRAWGQIVLAKAETLDVQRRASRKGLRPIDPQHDLMDRRSAGAARAFEFHGDWTLPHHRHPIPAGGDQADQHRPGGGADGRHAGRRGRRAGALPRPQCAGSGWR